MDEQKIAQLEKALEYAAAYTHHLLQKVHGDINTTPDKIAANWLEIAAQDINK